MEASTRLYNITYKEKDYSKSKRSEGEWISLEREGEGGDPILE
jgi:hypothetical protein